MAIPADAAAGATARRTPATTAADGPGREPVGIGAATWVAVVGTIGAWMTHLVAMAALVPVMCRRPTTEWVMHSLTVSLAAVTVAAGLVCWRLARTAGDDRRRRFLGWFGLITAATNLVLILAEGTYVFLLDPCA